MKYEIKNRFNGNIIYQDKAESFSALIQAAIKAKANLQYADLHSANLQSADLRSADLQYADLHSANLQSADLRSADLRSANLQSADLRSADLRSANLRSANLQSADLRSADLRSANLQSANLQYADLQYADLHSANLQSANLPAPTMLLLASWGEVSESLTADLMLLDSSAHPDALAFQRWVEGGSCPYENVKVQRIANFKEVKGLWGKGKVDTIYNLVVRLLREKAKTDLQEESNAV